MSLTPRFTSAFKKDFKRIKKRGYDITLLHEVISILASEKKLSSKHYTHPLKGNHFGYYECHIKPDWLLIWKINLSHKTIEFARTGTHSDLFK